MKNYQKYASRFRPDNIKVLFIAESPPKSENYFYCVRDKPGPLFMYLMQVVFNKTWEELKKEKKKVLLEKFKEKGYFLTDVFEHPIYKKNKKEKEKSRKNLIQRLENFEKDGILDKKRTKIILISTTSYENKDILIEEGFNVLNKENVPFPSNGHQNVFKEKIKHYLNQNP
ncbi:MAG: hypothetical protein QXZ43_01455 [Candidatus Aenigmatarchaeota archaeon]